jgi:hypothetical protein
MKHPQHIALSIIADGLESARAYSSWELADHYISCLKELVAGRPAFGERTVKAEVELRGEVIPTVRHEVARDDSDPHDWTVDP